MIIQSTDKKLVACTECDNRWKVKPKCTIAPDKIVCFLCRSNRIKLNGAIRRSGVKFIGTRPPD